MKLNTNLGHLLCVFCTAVAVSNSTETSQKNNRTSVNEIVTTMKTPQSIRETKVSVQTIRNVRFHSKGTGTTSKLISRTQTPVGLELMAAITSHPPNILNQGQIMLNPLEYVEPDVEVSTHTSEKMRSNTSVYGNKSFALPAYEFIAPVILGICLLSTIVLVGILLKRGQKSSSMTKASCVLLAAIAIADALTMIFALAELIYLYTERRRNYMFLPPRSCSTMLVLERLSAIPHAVSTWLTVILAIQRYLCVSVPFDAAKYIDVKSSIIYVTVTNVFSACLHACRFIDTQFEETYITLSSVPDVSIHTCSSKYRSWVKYPLRYESVFAWIRILTTQLLPCILIVIFVALMLKTLIKKNVLSKHVHRAKRQMVKRQLTIFVLIISIIVFGVEFSNAVFLSFNALDMSTGIAIYSYETLKTASVGFDIVLYVSYFVIFVIYCLMSHEFRRTAVTFCHQICHIKDNGKQESKELAIINACTSAPVSKQSKHSTNST